MLNHSRIFQMILRYSEIFSYTEWFILSSTFAIYTCCVDKGLSGDINGNIVNFLLYLRMSMSSCCVFFCVFPFGVYICNFTIGHRTRATGKDVNIQNVKCLLLFYSLPLIRTTYLDVHFKIYNASTHIWLNNKQQCNNKENIYYFFH